MGNFLTDLAGKAKKRASQAYDQVNVFDNGLSYQQRQVNPNVQPRSVVAQATPIGKAIVRAPAQMLNTIGAQVPQVYYTGAGQVAAMTGNNEALNNAIRMQNISNEMFDQNKGGLFNVGTFYGAEDAKRGDLKTGIQKVGGGTLQTAATVIPFAKGGSFALKGAPITKGALLRLGGEGMAYGASYSTGNQLQETGRVDPKRLATDTLIGAGANIAIPTALRGVKNAGVYAKNNPIDNEIGAVGRNVKGPNLPDDIPKPSQSPLGKVSGDELSKQTEANNLVEFVASPYSTPKDAKIAQARLQELAGNAPVPKLPKSAKKPQLPGAEPIKLNPDQKLAKLPQSIRESVGTPPEFAKMIKDSGYTVKPNADTLSKAYKTLETNPMDLVNEVMGMNVGGKQIPSITGRALPNADEVAKSMAAMDYLVRNGQFEVAAQMEQHLTRQATGLGQAVQIFSTLGKTTPAGVYKYAQGLAQKAGITVDDDLLNTLVNEAKRIEGMPPGRGQDVARAQLLARATEVVPATAGNKAAMSLYLAQLVNPKTAIRNVAGNAFMLGAQNISDTLAAPIDALRSGITGAPRQVYMPNLVQQAKSFSKGLKYGVEDANLGIDTRGLVQGKWDVKPNTFRSPVGKGAEKVLSMELGATDRAFYQVAVDQMERNLMKGAGVDKATPQMKAMADNFGRYMTYQDDTALARVASGLKKTLNVGKPFGVGNFVINYPKTPANLINRAVAFSPAGYAKATMELYRVVSNNPRASALAVEQALARATVGSAGLVGTGAMLHKVGIIQSDENRGKTDINAFQKATGGGQYTINTSALKRYVLSGFDEDAAKKREGDKTVSYDWAQPLAVSLTIGANIDNYNKDTGSVATKVKGAFGSVGAATASGVQTIVEQPLLQGVQRAFNSNSPVQGLIDTAKAVPNSFIPALVRQTRQIVDPNTRNTYDPNPINESANLVRNSIPGLSRGLPLQVNPSTGQPNQVYQNGNNPFNVYLNPAFTSTIQHTPVTRELDRLYQQQGEAKVIPNIVQKSYQINGQTRILSAPEYNDMQKFVGEQNVNYLNQVFADPKYQQADDLTKAKIVSGVLQDVTAAAKQRFLGAEASTDKGVDAISTHGFYPISKATLAQKNAAGKTTYGGVGTDDYYGAPDAEYKYQKAKYDQSIKDGTYKSDAERIRAESTLAKSEVGSKYGKDVRDLYGLSKAQVYGYLSKNQNGTEVAEQLLAYGDAMVDAGIMAYNKFRDRAGNVAIKPSTKGSSKGGKKGRTAKGKKPTLPTSLSSTISAYGSIRSKVANAKVKGGSSRVKTSAGRTTAYKQPTKARVA